MNYCLFLSGWYLLLEIVQYLCKGLLGDHTRSGLVHCRKINLILVKLAYLCDAVLGDRDNYIPRSHPDDLKIFILPYAEGFDDLEIHIGHPALLVASGKLRGENGKYEHKNKYNKHGKKLRYAMCS